MGRASGIIRKGHTGMQENLQFSVFSRPAVGGKVSECQMKPSENRFSRPGACVRGKETIFRTFGKYEKIDIGGKMYQNVFGAV